MRLENTAGAINEFYADAGAVASCHGPTQDFDADVARSIPKAISHDADRVGACRSDIAKAGDRDGTDGKDGKVLGKDALTITACGNVACAGHCHRTSASAKAQAASNDALAPVSRGDVSQAGHCNRTCIASRNRLAKRSNALRSCRDVPVLVTVTAAASPFDARLAA